MSTLFIIPTPIGNLKDITQRALNVLSEVDYIACEDTRTSGKLLSTYNINSQLFSFHQHNEHQKLEYLMDLLKGGLRVAIISDAGMPGISDPGFLAIREAHKNGITVSVLPGPDAVTTALIASGLPCDRYIFEGFVPRKKGRKTMLDSLVEEERTVILYESCHRIKKLVQQLEELLEPSRMMAICRELTKKFEEILRGSVSHVATQLKDNTTIKGEFVVVIGGKSYRD